MFPYLLNDDHRICFHASCILRQRRNSEQVKGFHRILLPALSPRPRQVKSINLCSGPVLWLFGGICGDLWLEPGQTLTTLSQQHTRHILVSFASLFTLLYPLIAVCFLCSFTSSSPSHHLPLQLLLILNQRQVTYTGQEFSHMLLSCRGGHSVFVFSGFVFV